MTTLSSETLHATTVAIDGVAVVIEGRSGSGKSDLALRLIDRGAVLVADDATILQRDGKRLLASVRATIAGRIEVRGVGIVTLPHVDRVAVGLIVRLTHEIVRLPELQVRRIANIDVREIAVDPAQASAPLKVEYALRQPAAIVA